MSGSTMCMAHDPTVRLLTLAGCLCRSLYSILMCGVAVLLALAIWASSPSQRELPDYGCAAKLRCFSDVRALWI